MGGVAVALEPIAAPEDATEDDPTTAVERAAWNAAHAPFAEAPPPDIDPDLLEALDLREATSVGEEAVYTFDKAKHPRWPAGTAGGLGGQFMHIGQRFEFDGHEWEIQHVLDGKIVANEASGKVSKAQVRIFDPAKTAGAPTTFTGAKRPKPRLLRGGGKLGTGSSDVVVVSPYVDSATHDPKIALPADSKLTPEEWKRFGRIEQMHYVDLMKAYGPHTDNGATSLIKQAYADYESEVQSVVSGGYSSQYGSSSGWSISLTAIFQNLTGAVTENMRRKRERSLELQARIRDAYAWDLYNRTHAPDVSLVHKSSNHPQSWWQQNFIDGNKPILNGLSQSQHYRPGWRGNQALATPTSIRNIVMATWVAGPKKGAEKDYIGEEEMAIPFQQKLDKRSIAFDEGVVPSAYKKWLAGLTGQRPQSGHLVDMFREAVLHGGDLPIPPPEPEISIHSKNQIVAPQQAANAMAEYGKDLPGGGGGAWTGTPADLKKFKLPWANVDAKGAPVAELASDSGVKEGDFLMGLKGTLYWVGPDPANKVTGLRLYKMIPDGAGGMTYETTETYALDNEHKNYKLKGNVPMPKSKDEPVFDVNAWIHGSAKQKIGQLAPDTHFMVDGTPYVTVAKGNAATTPIQDLSTGNSGTINSQYATYALLPKPGYVSPGAKLQPAKGMSLAYNGKKHIVTTVKKDGTVSIRRSTGGKVITLAPDDVALDGLFDPEQWKQAKKAAPIGNLVKGDLFHGGRGAVHRPYRVESNDGTWVTWTNLDTGEGGKSLVKKKVKQLLSLNGDTTPTQPPEATVTGPPTVPAVTGNSVTVSALHPGSIFTKDGLTYQMTGFGMAAENGPPDISAALYQGEGLPLGPASGFPGGTVVGVLKLGGTLPTASSVVGKHHGYTEGQEVEIQSKFGTWKAKVVGHGTYSQSAGGKDWIKVLKSNGKDYKLTVGTPSSKVLTMPIEAAAYSGDDEPKGEIKLDGPLPGGYYVEQEAYMSIEGGVTGTVIVKGQHGEHLLEVVAGENVDDGTGNLLTPGTEILATPKMLTPRSDPKTVAGLKVGQLVDIHHNLVTGKGVLVGDTAGGIKVKAVGKVLWTAASNNEPGEVAYDDGDSISLSVGDVTPITETTLPGGYTPTPTETLPGGYTAGQMVAYDTAMGGSGTGTVEPDPSEEQLKIKIASVTKPGTGGGTEPGDIVFAAPSQVWLVADVTNPTPASTVALDTAIDSLPSLSENFAAYASSYGSGGKYKHDKINTMLAGTVFQGKDKKLYKVQVAGPTPIVTDGNANFTINGNLRGRALPGEVLDGPPPPTGENLPGYFANLPTTPSTTSVPPPIAHDLNVAAIEDQIGAKLGELGLQGAPLEAAGDFEVPLDNDYTARFIVDESGAGHWHVTKPNGDWMKTVNDIAVAQANDPHSLAQMIVVDIGKGKGDTPRVKHFTKAEAEAMLGPNTESLTFDQLPTGAIFGNGVGVGQKVGPNQYWNYANDAVQTNIAMGNDVPLKIAIPPGVASFGEGVDVAHPGQGVPLTTPEEWPNNDAKTNINDLPVGAMWGVAGFAVNQKVDSETVWNSKSGMLKINPGGFGGTAAKPKISGIIEPEKVLLPSGGPDASAPTPESEGTTVAIDEAPDGAKVVYTDSAGYEHIWTKHAAGDDGLIPVLDNSGNGPYVNPATTVKILTGPPSMVGDLNPEDTFFGGDGAKYKVVTKKAGGNLLVQPVAGGEMTEVDPGHAPGEVQSPAGLQAAPDKVDWAQLKKGDKYMMGVGTYRVMEVKDGKPSKVALVQATGGLQPLSSLPPDGLKVTPQPASAMGHDVPPVGQGTLGDLQPGDEFEGKDGHPFSFVSLTHGTESGQPDTAVVKDMQSEALTSFDAATYPIDVKPVPSPPPSDDLSDGTVEINSPTAAGSININTLIKQLTAGPAKHTDSITGYKSAWGSGGKYKHEKIETLEPGTKFHGKDGKVYVYLEPDTVAGKTMHLVFDPATGQGWYVEGGIRVRRVV